MNGALPGKTALVTGAGRGIGREIALELARQGADIIVNDVSNAEATVEEIRHLGRRALAVYADVGSSADVD
ncbi:MAG: hypothetical protein DMG59_25035, partial [Acidobacteria bacterium]